MTKGLRPITIRFVRTLEGTLLPLTVDRGSKSERPGFVVRFEDGSEIRVEHVQDHPFDPSRLRSLAYHRVRATGRDYRNRFLAEEVVALD